MFDLLEELKKHTPFDEKEKENISMTIEFLENNENCYSRSNLKGHITAGGFVADRQGNILFNHHKVSDMWFQFGGHSDGDEDSLNVARREVMEECGITNMEIASSLIFDVGVQEIEYNERKKEPEHTHYDINFLFIVDSHDFQISDESKEIKWVTIDEAKTLADPNDDCIHRMIIKYENYLNNIY